MKTVLSFIATSWVILEVLYTIVERYNWSLYIFDTVLALLTILGVFLLTKHFIKKKTPIVDKSIKRILLVEDEPLINQLICEKLEDHKKFRITHSVTNGKEALLLLKKYKYDLVITDIDMPEMDGFELSKIIKRDYPNLKVLAISMYTSDERLKAIVGSGFAGYLDKEYLDSNINSAIYSVINDGCYYSNHVQTLFKNIHKLNFHPGIAVI